MKHCNNKYNCETISIDITSMLNAIERQMASRIWPYIKPFIEDLI